MLRNRATRSAQGFTLIEMMIVVAIIAILAAVAIPSWKRSTDQAKAGAVFSSFNDCLRTAFASAMAGGVGRGCSFPPEASIIDYPTLSLFATANGCNLPNGQVITIKPILPRVTVARYRCIHNNPDGTTSTAPCCSADGVQPQTVPDDWQVIATLPEISQDINGSGFQVTGTSGSSMMRFADATTLASSN